MEVKNLEEVGQTKSSESILLAAKKKGKSAKTVNGFEYFGLEEGAELDFEKTWAIFVEKGFSLVVDTIKKGIDSKSANIDVNQYAAIYHIMYSMTIQTENHAQDMYHNTKSLLEDYILGHVCPALESLTGTRLLQEFRTCWHNHLFMSCWMRRFMHMLDDSCVINKGLNYTASMTLRTFYKTAYQSHCNIIIQSLLEEITKYRDSEECDLILISDISTILQHMGTISTKAEIHKVVADNKEFKSGKWKSAPALVKQLHNGQPIFLTELKVYLNDFQGKFITYTEEYYRKKSAKWQTSASVSEYLAKSVASLKMEKKLAEKHLHAESTKDKLIHACEQMILVGPDECYLNFILKSDTGVGYMLVNDQFDDLRNMHYVLSGNIGKQQPMADAMRDHIASKGFDIITKRAQQVKKAFSNKKQDEYKISDTFINELLDLYRKYDTLIKNEFNKDVLFEKALVQAFQKIMKNEPIDHLDSTEIIDEKQNLRHVCPNSEMLASHIDHIYRHSNDFDTNDVLEKCLTECASLFDYLTDKDTFIAFHTQKLSERLLNKKLDNTDSEKFFIGEIKIKQGPQFTNQQETMIADMEKFAAGQSSSQEGDVNSFSLLFKNTYLNGESKDNEDNMHAKRWKSGGGFNVKLLTQSSWPSVPNPPEIIIPSCMRNAIAYHEKFYKSFNIHSSRQLLWSHMLGEMELIFSPKRKGKTKNYRVQMSPLQAYVCLSFHSFDHKLTGVELNELLNFDGSKGKACHITHASKLKRVLYAFCFTKRKIMFCKLKDGTKEKKKFTCIEDSTFQFDINFKNEKIKFKIPRPEFNSKKVINRVKEDRKMTIDACLVRIMKAATVKTQDSLIGEVLEQLTTFAISRRDVKPRIQGLIDEGYFERDEDEQNLLHYLA